ncbi:type II CAAX prenyl endopeptidase Rce1 family protein [Listeria grayi]|uniref:CAAX amino terminal protease family protein n=2 Tax=Listeria grayi TaxID=1641 RepID=D7V0Z3_LISGR|nr:CPBP family glutamic-type intramembrane protease [Listeria grayi]EFI83225.1 CAAX amino terminal protease family protein [Listeria grayi DSM 20601]STY43758.1 CAAX amino terminal protease self- immunity [Listeria grayi]
MKSNKIDYKLIAGFILCALLIALTYHYRGAFWYLYGACTLFLMSFVIFNEDLEKKSSFTKNLFLGIVSGIALYVVFYIGAILFKVLPGGLDLSVKSAFAKYSTDSLLIWLLLIFIIVPGEEIFWRGFVLERLNHYFHPIIAAIISAAILALFMCVSKSIAVVVSIFVASLIWNLLYQFRKSVILTYLSHLTFIFLLLVALPLY